MAKKFHRLTKRLIIRPLVKNDYKAWKAAYSSGSLPLANRWDQGNKSANELTREKFSELLKKEKKQRETDVFFSFGIFLRPRLDLVGLCSLMDISRGLFQNAYFGYRIFNRHWRKGYGKEAAAACIDIGFNDLCLHRIEAGIEPFNRRSISLARSLKMRLEGKKRRSLFLRDHWIDILIYSLTCEDLGLKFRGPHPKKS